MRWFWIFVFVPALLSAQAAPTPLSALIAEAQHRNPGVRAARYAWRAAQAAIAPAGALPDPQAMVQQMQIGRPLPFAGASSSDFAYTGVAVSQALPYPGKLKLQAASAAATAAVRQAQWRQMRRALTEQVEAAYDRLAYLRSALNVLARQNLMLAQAERLAEVGYRNARGPQAAVLSAQLEKTQLLRQQTTLQQQWDSQQAQLRALLDRPPQAPAIIPEILRQTQPVNDGPALSARLSAADPALAAQQARIARARRQAALARKDFHPDFSAQFMYQRMGNGMGNAYQWTLGMSLPWFHRATRQRPELERALDEQLGARADLAQTAQQDRFQLNDALLRAASDAQILALDRQGLLPQAAAAMQSALSAYAAGSEDFQSFLDAWRQDLALQQQYWSTLADHEIQLSRVTALTGVPHD